MRLKSTTKLFNRHSMKEFIRVQHAFLLLESLSLYIAPTQIPRKSLIYYLASPNLMYCVPFNLAQMIHLLENIPFRNDDLILHLIFFFIPPQFDETAKHDGATDVDEVIIDREIIKPAFCYNSWSNLRTIVISDFR